MKNMYRTLAVSALLGSLALTAYAQDFKAGFVNTDRIFREANSAKAAQGKLDRSAHWWRRWHLRCSAARRRAPSAPRC